MICSHYATIVALPLSATSGYRLGRRGYTTQIYLLVVDNPPEVLFFYNSKYILCLMRKGCLKSFQHPEHMQGEMGWDCSPGRVYLRKYEDEMYDSEIVQDERACAQLVNWSRSINNEQCHKMSPIHPIPLTCSHIGYSIIFLGSGPLNPNLLFKLHLLLHPQLIATDRIL